MSDDPDRAAALFAAGLAVETDRTSVLPVKPAPNRHGESYATLGGRAVDSWDYPAADPARAYRAGSATPHNGEDTIMPTDWAPTPAMWIDHDETHVCAPPMMPIRDPFSTPAYGDSFGALLNRLDQALTRPAGTVLLAGSVPRDLGLKGKTPPSLASVRQAPALEDARRHGWTISAVRPWMIARRPEGSGRDRRERVIHIGVVPWLTRDTFPLLHEQPARVIFQMSLYHGLTGVPYHGETAGLVGIDMIRQQPRRRVPRWVPDWSRIEPAKVATVTAYRWDAPAETAAQATYWHGYDVNMQYLSAAGTATLAVDQLDYQRGPIAVQASNAPGYYRITVPAWQAAELPHPVGPLAEPGADRWVTAPTLDLLHWLAHDAGVIAEPEVHEAWTARGSRLLRDWSTRLREAVADTVFPEHTAVRSAVKQTYTSTIGLFARTGGRIHRPDWQHTIIGQANASLFRAMWLEFCTTGRTPMKVDADCVYYPSEHEDPYVPESWPETFERLDKGTRGGTWKWSKDTIVTTGREARA